MLTTIAVENYRSLRRLVVPLRQLNVVTGHNGSGKSNLYRALRVLADPVRAPELMEMRERTRGWRFYDHLRTDADAPARQSRIGTRTTVLGHDGADLAAALQTIHEIGDSAALSEAIDRAFDGSRIGIRNFDGRFDLSLQQPGMLRPLGAAVALATALGFATPLATSVPAANPPHDSRTRYHRRYRAEKSPIGRPRSAGVCTRVSRKIPATG